MAREPLLGLQTKLLQTCFGDKLFTVGLEWCCPQSGTAVLRGLTALPKLPVSYVPDRLFENSARPGKETRWVHKRRASTEKNEMAPLSITRQHDSAAAGSQPPPLHAHVIVPMPIDAHVPEALGCCSYMAPCVRLAP